MGLEGICTLPSVVCSKILSYLHWKDKIVIAHALPGWNKHLHSSVAWRWVEFLEWRVGIPDDFEAVLMDDLKAQMKCIRKYGKYFQHLSIALSVFDVQPNSHGAQLLDQISIYCSNLKSLRNYHEFITGTYEFLLPLKRVCSECKLLRSIQICNLDDCPADRMTGKAKVFQVLNDLDLCKKIDLLEFTLDNRCPRPVTDLVLFKNLHTLKTEIVNLNQDVIQTLVNYNLRKLHVLKDRNSELWSIPHLLDWTKINDKRKRLDIHYIFEDIRVTRFDFTPNPFLTSITLNRISHAVSRDVIRQIADLYGNSLKTFVHFSMLHPIVAPYEDMESLPCDYYFFASQCVHLKTFIAGIPLQCEAIWCLAMKAENLKNLVIQKTQLLYKYRVCLPLRTLPQEGSLDNEASFCREISYWMNKEWLPLDEDAMCERTEHLMQL